MSYQDRSVPRVRVFQALPEPERRHPSHYHPLYQDHHTQAGINPFTAASDTHPGESFSTTRAGTSVGNRAGAAMPSYEIQPLLADYGFSASNINTYPNTSSLSTLDDQDSYNLAPEPLVGRRQYGERSALRYGNQNAYLSANYVPQPASDGGSYYDNGNLQANPEFDWLGNSNDISPSSHNSRRSISSVIIPQASGLPRTASYSPLPSFPHDLSYLSSHNNIDSGDRAIVLEYPRSRSALSSHSADYAQGMEAFEITHTDMTAGSEQPQGYDPINDWHAHQDTHTNHHHENPSLTTPRIYSSRSDGELRTVSTQDMQNPHSIDHPPVRRRSRRGKLSPDARAHAKEVRRRGACEKCRRKKHMVRLLFVYVLVIG